MEFQLDLIKQSEIELLREELQKVKEAAENVRRGLFARHNELAKLYLEQQKEIQELKCKAALHPQYLTLFST